MSRAWLIKVLGNEIAARVVEVLGGGYRVWVPEPDASRFEYMVAKLGHEIAQAFCREWGGCQVVLPKSLRNKCEVILELYDQGLKPSAIAHRVPCSERYVQRIVAENRS